MRLPDVQKELRAIARRIVKLEREISRRPSERGKVTSKPVTPQVKKMVRKLHRLGYLNQQQIAERLGINSGRVSEILKGKRK